MPFDIRWNMFVMRKAISQGFVMRMGKIIIPEQPLQKEPRPPCPVEPGPLQGVQLGCCAAKGAVRPNNHSGTFNMRLVQSCGNELTIAL